MYIERQLEKKFTAISEEYACVLLTGPRQVGKSTMLRHLMEGTARAEVSLDDLEERRLAKTDPAMFLKLHPAPVLIDEVQYAPELFSYIKIAVDNGARSRLLLADRFSGVSPDGACAGVAGRTNRHSSYVCIVTSRALRRSGCFALFAGTR